MRWDARQKQMNKQKEDALKKKKTVRNRWHIT